jgi:hypothetical protein
MEMEAAGRTRVTRSYLIGFACGLLLFSQPCVGKETDAVYDFILEAQQRGNVTGFSPAEAKAFVTRLEADEASPDILSSLNFIEFVRRSPQPDQYFESLRSIRERLNAETLNAPHGENAKSVRERNYGQIIINQIDALLNLHAQNRESQRPSAPPR